MSREIKFRAWDEENRQFADYEDIEECLSCQSRDGWRSSDGIGCCFGINAVEILADCIIEQYTGLKDKNGKEIYEGDIIRETISEDGITDGTYTYEVYWDEDLLIWSLNGIYDIYHMRNDLWETNASREVIGNIHENPELLGGEE